MAERDRRVDTKGAAEVVAQAVMDEQLPPPSTAVGGRTDEVALAMQRRIRALRLHNAGLSWEEVAVREGYSDASAARKAAIRALDAVQATEVAEHRALSGSRLVQLRAALMPIAVAPHNPEDATKAVPVHERIAAVNSLIRIEERWSKLMGLDAPTKIDLSTGVRSQVDEALATLHAALFNGEAYEVSDVGDDEPAAEGEGGAGLPRAGGGG